MSNNIINQKGEEIYTDEKGGVLSGSMLFKITTIAVLLLFSSIIGLGIRYGFNKGFREDVDNFVNRGNNFGVAQSNDKKAEISPSITSTSDARGAELKIDTKAADLRVTLNSLNKQHITLATTSMRSAVDTKPDLFAAKETLDMNSQDLGKTFGNIYGKETENKFLELWRSHVNELLNYSIAVKTNNKALIEQSSSSLNKFSNDFYTFLSEINPETKKDEIKNLINDYINKMKSVIDAYVPCDFVKSVQSQEEAYKLMDQLSDKLSIAIVAQHPEKFS